MNMDSTSIVSSKGVAPHVSFQCQPLHFFCVISPMHLIPYPPRFKHHLPRTPALVLADRRTGSLSEIRPADTKGQVGTQSLSCRLSTCVKESTRLRAGSCSSAYVLRAESCQGTCQRSTPKTCFLVCHQPLLIKLYTA